MAMTRHEAWGAAREPDGSMPGRKDSQTRTFEEAPAKPEGQPHGINADHTSTSRNHWAHWFDAAIGQWICMVPVVCWSSMRMSGAWADGAGANSTGMKSGLV